MDARQLAAHFHGLVHAAALSGSDHSWQDWLLRDLAEADLRARPAGMNPLAWLLWHMSRLEDVAVNAVLRDRPPVFESGTWDSRLGVAGAAGTGMSDEEVARFVDQVQIAGLLDYRLAVGSETRSWIESAAFEQALEVMPPVRRRLSANAPAIFDDRSEWVIDLWEGFSEPISFLALPVVGHQMMHTGEARLVRSLVTGRRGR